jgi:hypothetical protein
MKMLEEVAKEVPIQVRFPLMMISQLPVEEAPQEHVQEHPEEHQVTNQKRSKQKFAKQRGRPKKRIHIGGYSRRD